MLRNIGWVITVCLLIIFILFLNLSYFPLKQDLVEVQNELTMWEEMVRKKGEHLKTWQFAPSDFFDGVEIAPRGEISLARILDSLQVYSKGKTITISASGDKDKFFVWLGRINKVFQFIVKNSSLNPANFCCEYKPSQEEVFKIDVDD